MKIEGLNEFAQAVGRMGKRLDGAGRGMQSAGKSITKFGLNLLAAGLLLGLGLLLVYWVL